MNKNDLAIFGGPKTITQPGPHYEWPIVTPEMEQAVLKQLKDSISIYNKSGVFERFENTFSAYHGKKHALLCNSGTNAILSMYEGIQLGPGDEVICPTYTFFATASPLLFTGATPVFVDCSTDGNIDPSLIERQITPKTKAVVVTHMWGIPCNMEAIRKLCDDHGIYLLEDCSHAHGAKFNGKLVGTFGHAAAWSLQGQKLITGGEGGILLTDDPEIFYRSLLLGHYNKRCKQEIPRDHPLSRFSTTGFGLKLRAHPLAIAIAEEQFSHLQEWLQQKADYAAHFMEVLGQYKFIKLPNIQDRIPSWYAFVFSVNPESTGVNADRFDELLKSEGLVESDRPNATCPLHNLPLFLETNVVLPRLYGTPTKADHEFPEAVKFYNQAVKLPLWVRPQDRKIVESYKLGLDKICKAISKGYCR
ncbi:MAG: DegT/DnrJ/EryC1/StrS family aminotransferase [Dongiaceae bacterium]